MFGFPRFSENPETLLEVSPDWKLSRPSKSRFAEANVTNSRQSKGAQASTIQIECEQVPEILNTTQMIWLDVPLLVACSIGFLIFEADLELFKDRVA